MRKLGSRYVLHEVLGQGTTGQVWRAARVSDGAPVAIKVLRRELADDPQIVERFLREWDLLVDLDSPSLVAVRDLVREPDTLAIVMDLVDGPDLRAHLREFGPRPAEEAVGFAIGTLWALDSVHAAGIVHRDVKPENILIDPADPDRPIVRLTDFGIARVVGASPAHATGPVGTPLYMAPELGSGAPPTPAADVYSAGVVLYEVLAGSPPFDSTNPVELLRLHREEEPQPISGVPQPVWDVLARMLAKSPRARPTSAADAADELDEALTTAMRDAGAGTLGAHEQTAMIVTRRDREDAEMTGAHQRRTATRSAQAPTGTQRVPRPVAAAAGVGAAGVGAAGGAWNDMEHTQVAGSLTAVGTKSGGWSGGDEHTMIAPAAGGGRADWSADAPTGMSPAVRVPARSGGPAADTNTVMSAIPASRQPGSGSAAGGAGGSRGHDRRRRSRIAAGAGLVVALVAGAGGWALASGGGADSSLSAASTTGTSTDPSAVASSDGTGLGLPGVATGVRPAPGPGSTARPGARTTASPGSASAAPTSAPAASPTAGSSPSPSPTDDGTAAVPNTEGSSFNAAVNTLQAAGFTNVTKTFDCYNAGAVDAVVKQSPNTGRAAKSTTIKLQIQGNDCKEVPNVTGMTESAAKSTLSGAGFLFVNGSCPSGYASSVVSYSPNTGRHPSGSTAVTLNLRCNAPAPTTAPPTAAPTTAAPAAKK
ncbi:serine/threonine-protein kinase [Frankia sp. AgB32]|uniref:serine/threonine-protein kinase n=1 Tax=Frankia sp. AgB32 TaxID=631119 RepID=UPI00200EE281|nr:serine/threonine-protein kinase [Frankia sp. AgB32]MCK9894674.1 protein kinase [Frankia sp. AgB32]